MGKEKEYDDEITDEEAREIAEREFLRQLEEAEETEEPMEFPYDPENPVVQQIMGDLSGDPLAVVEETEDDE